MGFLYKGNLSLEFTKAILGNFCALSIQSILYLKSPITFEAIVLTNGEFRKEKKGVFDQFQHYVANIYDIYTISWRKKTNKY